MLSKNTSWFVKCCTIYLMTSCGSSSSDSNSSTLRTPSLKSCQSSAPSTLQPGVKISGKSSGKSFNWMCTLNQSTTFMQTNSNDYNQKNYKIDCTNPADSTHLENLWLVAPVAGAPLTVQMPWATVQPNMSARIDIGTDRLEQNSFEIDSANLSNIAAIVWSLELNSVLESKTGRRMKGCAEGAFTKTTTKPEGDFLMEFDVIFE